MSNTILFIFEGEKTEPEIFENMKRYYFQDKTNSYLIATYNTNIYKLYEDVFDDSDLDLVELLREKNKETLKDTRRDDVDQIYLFFDYDGQASNFDDHKIYEMLEFFNNETENGKLFISYPMVESLVDLAGLCDCNEERSKVLAKHNVGYKKHVKKTSHIKIFSKMRRDDWEVIIKKSVLKANSIVRDEYLIPEYSVFLSFEQQVIFKKQLSRFIHPLSKVAILCSFPMFILDYYGKVLYDMILREQSNE
ncbi:MAG: hypothetical protein RBS89_09270 [Candidatus Delongbacteria bacterium]|jgi:hypothetical protein|nr:hypothetical protein [Candidatus Delongbacteria bacterium]